MVEPDTGVRWQRSARRAHWRWKSRRGPGRPHIPAAWQRLILRSATEHPRWGAVRIVGELRALGFEVSARTVSRYRRQALRRPPSQSWRTFLRNHAPSIWAADLFTVQTLAFRTLYVLIVIDHDRRRIRHWNVTEHPNAPWIWRQMIEATACGQQPGFLIRDRDRSDGGRLHRTRSTDRDRDDSHSAARAERQRHRRAGDRDAPARVPRSRHRRQRTAAEAGAWSVRPALQRDAAASVIGARLSGATQAGAADAEPASRQQAAARRFASSVSVGRMRFCRPTRLHGCIRMSPLG